MKKRFESSIGFLKTTAIGGAVFLLPIAVLVVLLGYVYQNTVKVYEFLKPWSPFDSLSGVAILFTVAILLLLLACFFAGLLAQRALGVRLAGLLEGQLMKIFPKYGIYKDILAGKFGGNHKTPSLIPILLDRDGTQFLAFQADKLPSGQLVVYLPGSPDPWVGSIAIVSPSKVQPLSITFLETLGICERLGRDSSKFLATAIPANPSTDA
ncbi:MAG: DUF502 domain-containing protein [Planctomycetaceae bacterium]